MQLLMGFLCKNFLALPKVSNFPGVPPLFCFAGLWHNAAKSIPGWFSDSIFPSCLRILTKFLHSQLPINVLRSSWTLTSTKIPSRPRSHKDTHSCRHFQQPWVGLSEAVSHGGCSSCAERVCQGGEGGCGSCSTPVISTLALPFLGRFAQSQWEDSRGSRGQRGRCS